MIEPGGNLWVKVSSPEEPVDPGLEFGWDFLLPVFVVLLELGSLHFHPLHLLVLVEIALEK